MPYPRLVYVLAGELTMELDIRIELMPVVYETTALPTELIQRGAATGIRTLDLLLTKQPLYQLSYDSISM